MKALRSVSFGSTRWLVKLLFVLCCSGVFCMCVTFVYRVKFLNGTCLSIQWIWAIVECSHIASWFAKQQAITFCFCSPSYLKSPIFINIIIHIKLLFACFRLIRALRSVLRAHVHVNSTVRWCSHCSFEIHSYLTGCARVGVYVYVYRMATIVISRLNHNPIQINYRNQPGSQTIAHTHTHTHRFRNERLKHSFYL